MPNFEDDSGNCHAPDPNGVACYKSRIGCPIHPRQKRKRRECSELSALSLNNDRLRADNERLTRERDEARYFLKIFLHAHASNNAVPPHLEEQARKALEDKQ